MHYNRTRNELRLLRPPERFLDDANGLSYKSNRETTIGIDTNINIGIDIHHNRTENQLRQPRPPERSLDDYSGLSYKIERRNNYRHMH